MFGMQPGINMSPHGSMVDNYASTNQSKVLDPNKEYWVETSAQDGRVYYYHGKTRQSSWKLPTGENVQIIKQSEVYITFYFISMIIFYFKYFRLICFHQSNNKIHQKISKKKV